jgi:hypothetical protein
VIKQVQDCLLIITEADSRHFSVPTFPPDLSYLPPEDMSQASYFMVGHCHIGIL